MAWMQLNMEVWESTMSYEATRDVQIQHCLGVAGHRVKCRVCLSDRLRPIYSHLCFLTNILEILNILIICIHLWNVIMVKSTPLIMIFTAKNMIYWLEKKNLWATFFHSFQIAHVQYLPRQVLNWQIYHLLYISIYA